jgi:hypothetical protein
LNSSTPFSKPRLSSSSSTGSATLGLFVVTRRAT